MRMQTTEDHCTMFPDGDWNHCCQKHDADYLMQVDRTQADLELLFCVAEVNTPVAVIMFIGVSLMGWIWYKKAGNKKG